MATRPATYRRRGPDGPWPASLHRRLDDVSGAVNRWLRCDRRRWPRVVAAASVPAAVGVVAARRRLNLHPAVTL